MTSLASLMTWTSIILAGGKASSLGRIFMFLPSDKIYIVVISNSLRKAANSGDAANLGASSGKPKMPATAFET